MKFLKTSMILSAVSLALTLATIGGAAYLVVSWRSLIGIRQIALTSMRDPATRMEVNATVRKLIEQGRVDEVYSFYSAYTRGDRMRAFLWVSYSVANGIPVNLLGGIAHWESGFGLKLEDRNADGSPRFNNNGTRDFGDLRLNSATFASYTPEQLKNPELNYPLGIKLLYDFRARAQTWEGAVVAYNCGHLTNLGEDNLKYLVAVLDFEKQLDRAFSLRFPEL